jgi:hypothetical protein
MNENEGTKAPVDLDALESKEVKRFPPPAGYKPLLLDRPSTANPVSTPLYRIRKGDRFMYGGELQSMDGGGLLQQGYGRLDCDGNSFAGQFAEDKMNGSGCEKSRYGGAYEGDFKDGKKSGFGEYKGADGSEYKGGWSNNLREGFGKQTWIDGSYCGKWQQGLYKGLGKLKYVIKEQHVVGAGIFVEHSGEFKAGKASGAGVRQNIDGSMVRGQWYRGKLHGFALFSSSPHNVTSVQALTDDRSAESDVVYEAQEWRNGTCVERQSITPAQANGLLSRADDDSNGESRTRSDIAANGNGLGAMQMMCMEAQRAASAATEQALHSVEQMIGIAAECAARARGHAETGEAANRRAAGIVLCHGLRMSLVDATNGLLVEAGAALHPRVGTLQAAQAMRLSPQSMVVLESVDELSQVFALKMEVNGHYWRVDETDSSVGTDLSRFGGWGGGGGERARPEETLSEAHTFVLSVTDDQLRLQSCLNKMFLTVDQSSGAITADVPGEDTAAGFDVVRRQADWDVAVEIAVPVLSTCHPGQTRLFELQSRLEQTKAEVAQAKQGLVAREWSLAGAQAEIQRKATETEQREKRLAQLCVVDALEQLTLNQSASAKIPSPRPPLSPRAPAVSPRVQLFQPPQSPQSPRTHAASVSQVYPVAPPVIHPVTVGIDGVARAALGVNKAASLLVAPALVPAVVPGTTIARTQQPPGAVTVQQQRQQRQQQDRPISASNYLEAVSSPKPVAPVDLLRLSFQLADSGGRGWLSLDETVLLLLDLGVHLPRPICVAYLSGIGRGCDCIDFADVVYLEERDRTNRLEKMRKEKEAKERRQRTKGNWTSTASGAMKEARAQKNVAEKATVDMVEREGGAARAGEGGEAEAEGGTSREKLRWLVKQTRQEVANMQEQQAHLELDGTSSGMRKSEEQQRRVKESLNALSDRVANMVAIVQQIKGEGGIEGGMDGASNQSSHCDEEDGDAGGDGATPTPTRPERPQPSSRGQGGRGEKRAVVEPALFNTRVPV